MKTLSFGLISKLSSPLTLTLTAGVLLLPITPINQAAAAEFSVIRCESKFDGVKPMSRPGYKTLDECLAIHQGCFNVDTRYTMPDGSSWSQDKWIPQSCADLSEIVPNIREDGKHLWDCVSRSPYLKRYLDEASCRKQHGDACVHNLETVWVNSRKGADFPGEPTKFCGPEADAKAEFSQGFRLALGCWEWLSPEATATDGVCKNSYNPNTDTLIHRFEDQDRCTKLSSSNCDTAGLATTPYPAKMCFAPIRPRFNRANLVDYRHPPVLGQAPVKTGNSLWKADLIACNSKDSSFILSNGPNVAVCGNLPMAPQFHVDLFPQIYSCLQKTLPDFDPKGQTLINHWGVHSNRDGTDGLGLSAHAYASAIDLTGIQHGRHKYQFEKAMDDLTNAFEKYLFAAVPESQEIITVEEQEKLVNSFESDQTQTSSLEIFTFWRPFLSCMGKSGGVVRYINAGGLPRLESVSPNGNQFRRKVERLTGSRKTLAHGNHAHIP